MMDAPDIKGNRGICMLDAEFRPELTQEEQEFIEWLKNAGYDGLSKAMRDTDKEIFRKENRPEV